LEKLELEVSSGEWIGVYDPEKGMFVPAWIYAKEHPDSGITSESVGSRKHPRHRYEIEPREGMVIKHYAGGGPVYYVARGGKFEAVEPETDEIRLGRGIVLRKVRAGPAVEETLIVPEKEKDVVDKVKLRIFKHKVHGPHLWEESLEREVYDSLLGGRYGYSWSSYGRYYYSIPAKAEEKLVELIREEAERAGKRVPIEIDGDKVLIPLEWFGPQSEDVAKKAKELFGDAVSEKEGKIVIEPLLAYYLFGADEAIRRLEDLELYLMGLGYEDKNLALQDAREAVKRKDELLASDEERREDFERKMKEKLMIRRGEQLAKEGKGYVIIRNVDVVAHGNTLPLKDKFRDAGFRWEDRAWRFDLRSCTNIGKGMMELLRNLEKEGWLVDERAISLCEEIHEAFRPYREECRKYAEEFSFKDKIATSLHRVKQPERLEELADPSRYELMCMVWPKEFLGREDYKKFVQRLTEKGCEKRGNVFYCPMKPTYGESPISTQIKTAGFIRN